MAVKVIKSKRPSLTCCEGPDVELRLFLKQTAHQEEQKKSTLTIGSIAGRVEFVKSAPRYINITNLFRAVIQTVPATINLTFLCGGVSVAPSSG
jgi:hypothetical protein